MARRAMAEQEEAALIADVERARDEGTKPARIKGGPREDASVVFSVRLPLAEARRIRELAASMNIGIGDLLTDATLALAYLRKQRFETSSLRRLYLYESKPGIDVAAIDDQPDGFNTTVFTEGAPQTRSGGVALVGA